MGDAKRDGGVAVHEVVSGGFICHIGGLQKSPLLNGVISMRGARHEERSLHSPPYFYWNLMIPTDQTPIRIL